MNIVGETSGSWLSTTALNACHQVLTEDDPYACFFREDTRKNFQVINNFLNEWRDAEWALHEEIDLLNEDIEGLSERNTQLHDENGRLQSEVAELQAHGNLLRDANIAADQRRCELEKDLVTCRAEASCLHRRVETLAEEKERASSDNATLVDSLAALRAEKTEVEKECAKLRSLLAARTPKDHQPAPVLASPHLRRGRSRVAGSAYPAPAAQAASSTVPHHTSRTRRRPQAPPTPSARNDSDTANAAREDEAATQGKAKPKVSNSSMPRPSKGPTSKPGSSRTTSRSLTRPPSPPRSALPRSKSSRKADDPGENGASPSMIPSRTPIRERLRPRQRKEK